MQTFQLNLLSDPILTSLPPLSLYVHIPWCIQKCPYCDFNSHERSSWYNEKEYLEALIKDLEKELPNVWGRVVSSIFIGGGTPSLFSADSIDFLISQIRARLPLTPNAEITLEANPGTFEKEKFIEFSQAGVNRLSIGVQSFNDAHLKQIGRVHSRKEAIQALELALTTFNKVNADLMYALPNQTPKEALNDITQAIEIGVEHISAYHLTIEPNTAFAFSPPKNLPKENIALDIEEQIHGKLLSSGFEHYEISAFTKNQKYCEHNINYWQFGDYIGIGAGAHGKISFPDRIERTTRKKHPKEYLFAISQDLPYIERAAILKEELPFEFMMNILRLSKGAPKYFFQERTGLPLTAVLPMLSKAYKMDLMKESPDYLITTELGKKFLNNLLELFLPG